MKNHMSSVEYQITYYVAILHIWIVNHREVEEVYIEIQNNSNRV